jgi:predicted small metal-binding protein
VKTLHCSDAGYDCTEVIRGENEDEVVARAAEHGSRVHGIDATEPGLVDRIKGLIRDE